MKEIHNEKNYQTSIIIPLGLIFFGFLVSYYWKGGNIGIYLVVFFILGSIFLSKKFTTKVIIEETTICIFYYNWGFLKSMKFNINEVEIQSKFEVGNRGYKYKIIDILIKNKVVYTIKGIDGFDESDLDKISKAFENKNTQV